MMLQLVDRSASRSSVLLVTTAGATEDQHQTLDEAARTNQSRVGVVVLGVGSRVNGSEAAAVASRGDDGVVYADDFDHLLDTRVHFTRLLADKICGTRGGR